MKQNLLFLAVFLLTGFVAQAQISVGLKGGVNLAKLEYSNDGLDSLNVSIDDKNVTGLIAGAVIEIGVVNHFAILGELNFIQKGTLQEFADGSDFIKSKATFNYLEVPILAKLSIGSEKLGAYLLAGPNFSYGLSGKSSVEINIGGTVDKEEQDLDWKDDEIKRTDFGLNFGAGLQFGLGNARIFTDARYNIGFTNLDDSNNNDNSSITHRGIALTAGVLFAL